MLKTPTDLKPYWSRAGLRHPELATFSVDIRSPVLKPPPLAYFPMFPFCLLLFYIVFMLLPAKSLEFACGLVSSCSLHIFLHEVSIIDPSRCFVYYLQSSSATVHKKNPWNLQISWTNINLHIFFQILKDVTIKWYKPHKIPLLLPFWSSPSAEWRWTSNAATQHFGHSWSQCQDMPRCHGFKRISTEKVVKLC